MWEGIMKISNEKKIKYLLDESLFQFMIMAGIIFIVVAICCSWIENAYFKSETPATTQTSKEIKNNSQTSQSQTNTGTPATYSPQSEPVSVQNQIQNEPKNASDDDLDKYRQKQELDIKKWEIDQEIRREQEDVEARQQAIDESRLGPPPKLPEFKPKPAITKKPNKLKRFLKEITEY